MIHLSKSHGSLLVLGIALSVAACSGDDDDASTMVNAPGVSATVGGSGAQVTAPGVDVKTAQLALNEVSSNVDATVVGFNSGPPAGASASANASASAKPGAGDGDGTINVACLGGGAADADGHVNVVPAPLTVDVKLAISYDGCVTRTGTTIAGDINFSQTVEAAGQPLRIETIYQGDLQLSGAVNARCAVDMNVLVDEAGKAVQIQGSFCGQDASGLSLQLQPSWRAQ